MSKQWKNWAGLALFLASFKMSGLMAQEGSSAEPPVPTIRVNTHLVLVDVVVTDKNGKVVTDLKPGEVELYEDGKKKDITHFQYYSNESGSPEAPANTIAPNQPVDKTAPPLPHGRRHLRETHDPPPRRRLLPTPPDPS